MQVITLECAAIMETTLTVIGDRSDFPSNYLHNTHTHTQKKCRRTRFRRFDKQSLEDELLRCIILLNFTRYINAMLGNVQLNLSSKSRSVLGNAIHLTAKRAKHLLIEIKRRLQFF